MLFDFFEHLKKRNNVLYYYYLYCKKVACVTLPGGIRVDSLALHCTSSVVGIVDSMRVYVCMVFTYSRVWINRVRLPILLVVR